MRLEGQVALVTGGGGGIGGAVATALAAEGATTIVADLDLEHAREVAAAIAASGGRAEGARLDVTDELAIEELVAAALVSHGGLDVLVNSAGPCSVARFEDTTASQLRSLWEVHALGSFLCSRAVLPSMRERGYGRVVNVVSGPGGYGASAWTSAYQAAKSAQTTLARSMALAVAADGITVNCVSPGLVVTPLWEAIDGDWRRAVGKGSKEILAERLADRASYPLGRAVEPAEVAHAVLFFALPASGAVTGEVLGI